MLVNDRDVAWEHETLLLEITFSSIRFKESIVEFKNDRFLKNPAYNSYLGTYIMTTNDKIIITEYGYSLTLNYYFKVGDFFLNNFNHARNGKI